MTAQSDRQIVGDFDGANVVVTGAAQGIGAAIAQRFVEQGAHVFSFDLQAPAAPRPQVIDVIVDVADEKSVANGFDVVRRDHATIDVLVNNAGIQRVDATSRMTLEMWDLVVGTHLTGSFLCCRAAVPLMGHRGGAIVNVSSVAALQGLPGRAPYSAAKAGLLGFTRSLAVELAPSGVRVNAVAPGHTKTSMAERAFADGVLAEADIVQRVPMGRMAQPSEIADVVSFLAGPRSSYVTGQCVVVDGGWSVQGMIGRPAWV